MSPGWGEASAMASPPCRCSPCPISYFDVNVKLVLEVVNNFDVKGWRIEMEDAHSAVIGIPDQKENVSWFAGRQLCVF